MKLNMPTDSSYDLRILRCNSDIEILAIAVDLLSLPQITSVLGMRIIQTLLCYGNMISIKISLMNKMFC